MLGRDAMIVVEDRPHSAGALNLVSHHGAVGAGLVADLCGAIGESTAVTEPKHTEPLRGERVLWVAPEGWMSGPTSAPSTNFVEALASVPDLHVLRDAQVRLEVVWHSGNDWMHGSPETTRALTLTNLWQGPIEQVLVRALERLADPPRRRQVRLTAAPQVLRGIRGAVTLEHVGGAVQLRGMASLRQEAWHLDMALDTCGRHHAYGTGDLARAFLDERQPGITHAALEHLGQVLRSRLPRLNTAIVAPLADLEALQPLVAEGAENIRQLDVELRDALWVSETIEADLYQLAQLDVVFVFLRAHHPNRSRARRRERAASLPTPYAM